MAQKELVYKVKVINEAGEVVETLAQDINTLNKSVKDLEDELNNTELGSDQWKDLQKELKNSKGALQEAQNAGKSLGEQFASIPGPIGSVVQGVQGLSSAFKLLLANPVALILTGIVTALTALYKAFTSTKEGGEQMAQVTAALGAVMDVFRDVLVKVTKALIDVFTNPKQALEDFGNLLKENIVNRVEGMLELIPALGKAIKLALSGEFKEAGKVATNAIGKVTLGVENITDKVAEAGNAIKNTFGEAIQEAKIAASITKELQRIDDAQRELNNRRAEQNKLIAEAKLKINDENLSIGERLEALEEVRKAEISLADQEAALAKRRYEAIRAQNALSDSSKEALDAEAAAYQEMLRKQQESSQKQKELFDQQKALRDQEKANIKAVSDMENALRVASVENEKKRREDELQAAYEADLQNINLLKTSEEKKAELRLLAEDKLQAGINAVQKEYRQKEIDAETQRLDALLELEALKYDTEEELAAADLQRTIDLMRQKTDLMLENAELTSEQRLLIEEQYNEAVNKLQEDQLAATTALKQKEAELYKNQAMAAANALGMIAQAAGENTELGKIAAMTQATINTYLAASNAYEEALKFGGPFAVPLGVAAAAAAVAIGLSQVQKIASIDTNIPKPKLAMGGIVEGQGSGTMDNIPVMLSSGESVINARSTALFRPTLDLINQLGGGDRFGGGIVSNGIDLTQMELLQSVKKGNQQPVRAYVVASQANNQLQLDRQVKSRSLV